MANINFPSSPTQSQVYTFGSSSWTFNGTAWVSTNGALGSSGTSGANGSSGTSGSSGSSGISGYVDNDWLFFTPTTTTIPSTGNNFVLSGTVTSNGSVSYNQSTGIITLAANKTYKLEAILALANNVNNSELNYNWINVTNSNANIGNTGALLVSNSTAPAAWQPVASAIITTTATTQVALRADFSNSTGGLNTFMCRFIVNQINGWSGSSGTSGSSGSSGTSGLSFTVLNNVDNRVLTATGTASQVNAESNLTFDGTNLNSPYFQSTNSVGAEGGQINLALAQTTGLTSSYVNIDIYADKLRIFEDGGNNRGVYIDLSKAPNTVGGELLTKASGFVNAGDYVTLGNLKARIPTSGNRSLQISTVTGTYSVYGSGVSVFSSNVGSTTITSSSPLSVSTTPAYLNSGNTFGTFGGTDTWNIMDTSNSIAWRISCIIGASYNNNMISIERLV